MINYKEFTRLLGLGTNLSVAEEHPSRNERISSGDNLECSLVEKRLDLDQKTWVRIPAFLSKRGNLPFFLYGLVNIKKNQFIY